jgi:GTP1/Obg family GTP-binding protein
VLDTTLHKQLEVKMNWTSFYAEIVNGHHDHDYTSPCISNRQNLRSEIRKLMRKYIHIIGFCYSAPLRRTILFKIINVFHILKQGICFMYFFQLE